jgi:serine/threonine protein kinase
MSAGLSDSRASLYSSLNSGGGGNGSSGSLILGTGYDSHGRLQKLAASAAVTAETLGSGLGDHSGLLIDPALVSVTHKLAAGAYGAVYLGVFAGVNVVVKELYSQVLEGDNEELLHEARMLHALRHPRIVTFYGVTWRVSGPAPPGWKGGSGAAPEPVNIERSSAGTSYESAGVAQSLNDTADWLEVDEASGDDFLSSSAPTWGAAFFGGSELGDRPLAVSDDGAFALNGGGGSGASRPARAARPTPVRSTSRPRALSPDSQAWAGLMQAAEDEHAKLLLVIEYCGQGSLGEAIRKGNYDTRADFFRHAIQLAGTLDWLHRKSPPIIHRDIKPGNMLLDDRGDLKLCDLGLARAQPLESGEGGTSDALATMTGGLGSAPFVPPEIMKGGASGVGGFEAATVGSLSNSLYDPTFIDSSEDTGDSRLESYLAGTPNKVRMRAIAAAAVPRGARLRALMPRTARAHLSSASPLARAA